MNKEEFEALIERKIASAYWQNLGALGIGMIIGLILLWIFHG